MTQHLEIKAALAVTDAGEITGTAWPFGTPDRVGDVIERGAFASPAMLPMLWAHNPAETIGVWNSISETPEGLIIKGRLLVDDVARAREVHALVKAGAVSGLSIGFVSRKALPRQGGGRTISALDLHEISVVAVPAHPDARITAIKATPATIENGDSQPMENDQIKNDQIKNEPNAQPAPVLDTKALDAITARLDAIEAKGQRPGAASDPVGGAERKSFIEYLRTGDRHTKAGPMPLLLSNDTASHVLAPHEIAQEFLRNLVEFSPIRRIADVRTTTSQTVVLPKRTGVTNAKWVQEISEREHSAPTFSQMNVEVHELATFTEISLQMAEDSENVLDEVMAALAEDFGQKESAAFVNGEPLAGFHKRPQGFMTHPDIKTYESSAIYAITAEALIKMMYALPATYRHAGTWVMGSSMLAQVRTLETHMGAHLWQPSFQLGQPETILGRPVVEAVDMPDDTDTPEGRFPIIFGDFKRGFRIYDRIELDILADPFTVRDKGRIRYHARRRVGSDVIRPDAFCKLHLHTSGE